MNSQEYIEVAISIAPFSEENAEIVTAEISELPFESFTMDDPYLRCYIQKELYDAHELKVVLSGVEGMGFDVDFSANLMPAVNWNAVWESQFTPIVVDGKCTIKASFHEDLKKTRFNITIDPKMAFGTGHHQTTYMMCRALLENEAEVKDKVVLDMGCGTAILAILAAKAAGVGNAYHRPGLHGWLYRPGAGTGAAGNGSDNRFCGAAHRADPNQCESKSGPGNGDQRRRAAHFF